jgi:hypothetical protein
MDTENKHNLKYVTIIRIIIRRMAILTGSCNMVINIRAP